KCFPVIKTAVDEFNKYAKLNLSIGIDLVHWSTDSYPESGGPPQSLLNKQIVDSADAAVAIFWTRFGTPTDKYGSGTEEEISELLNSGRQVFLYFLDIPVPPSMTDTVGYHEQRAKVSAYKKMFSGKGIYCDIPDLGALKKQFSRHLALYFTQRLAEDSGVIRKTNHSELFITAVNGSPIAVVQHLSLSDCQEMKEKRLAIVDDIKSVTHIVIVQPPNNENDGTEPDQPTVELPAVSTIKEQLWAVPGLFKRRTASFSEDEKVYVIEFCKNACIAVTNDFWYLGGLEIEATLALSFSMPFGGKTSTSSLVRTDEEKYKYILLKKIICDIVEYVDLAYGNGALSAV
ncbi:MAG: hypothetical protein LBR98_03800, partial [Syntrophomonadaceae bacterium]|nr:hypothetical protein [Syntrophomonadaceae bacterium]